MTVTLRPYQTDIVERVRRRFHQKLRRVLIQAATGAGKTTISSEFVRCAVAKGKRVLFGAHRRRLIDQKSERLDLFGIPHGIIMRGYPANPAAPVQVCSRDTLLSRSLRNRWVELPPADLVIVDEAHNLGDGYRDLLAAYPSAYVLGMTATPADSEGRGLGRFFQSLECAIPTSELVRQGYLVPVRCYAPEGAVKKGQRKLTGNPVQHWKAHADGRPTVLFAGKVEASLAACDAFLRAGIPAEHIDAGTPDDEREAVIARVVSGRTLILCNVGVLTEGVDIPQLSCCILLRMAGAYVLYAQAVGRVMRPHPAKTDAVLLDHSGAVFQHGFPDEDVEWSLDASATVDQRVKKAKEEGERREAICCPACGFLFSGATSCPACGKKIPRKRKEERRDNDLLVEVPREQQEAVDREERVRYWHRCLRVMAATGRSTGAASSMFKGRYGDWPDASLPNVPRPCEYKLPVALVFPQYARRPTPG